MPAAAGSGLGTRGRQTRVACGQPASLLARHGSAGSGWLLWVAALWKAMRGATLRTATAVLHFLTATVLAAGCASRWVRTSRAARWHWAPTCCRWAPGTPPVLPMLAGQAALSARGTLAAALHPCPAAGPACWRLRRPELPPAARHLPSAGVFRAVSSAGPAQRVGAAEAAQGRGLLRRAGGASSIPACWSLTMCVVCVCACVCTPGLRAQAVLPSARLFA